MNLPKYLQMKQEANGAADIYIYGEITDDPYEENGASAVSFRNVLKSIGEVKEINLHINSPGGNVFEGIAIYNMLKQSKAKVNVYIDALAASIASVIAMSGDTIFMPKNSTLMIHKPYEGVVGNADELRKEADVMDKITQLSVEAYLEKAGDKLDEATVTSLMAQESWLTADEAIEYGLADEIVAANSMVASLNNPYGENFKHVPKQLVEEDDSDEDDPLPDEEPDEKCKKKQDDDIPDDDTDDDSEEPDEHTNKKKNHSTKKQDEDDESDDDSDDDTDDSDDDPDEEYLATVREMAKLQNQRIANDLKELKENLYR